MAKVRKVPTTSVTDAPRRYVATSLSGQGPHGNRQETSELSNEAIGANGLQGFKAYPIIGWSGHESPSLGDSLNGNWQRILLCRVMVPSSNLVRLRLPNKTKIHSTMCQKGFAFAHTCGSIMTTKRSKPSNSRISSPSAVGGTFSVLNCVSHATRLRKRSQGELSARSEEVTHE